jgi:hypothetical protein
MLHCTDKSFSQMLNSTALPMHTVDRMDSKLIRGDKIVLSKGSLCFPIWPWCESHINKLSFKTMTTHDDDQVSLLQQRKSFRNMERVMSSVYTMIGHQ